MQPVGWLSVCPHPALIDCIAVEKHIGVQSLLLNLHKTLNDAIYTPLLDITNLGFPILKIMRGHGDVVVTHLPPTSEVSGSNPRPYVGKLVVTDGRQFTVQNLDQVYVLVSSPHKTDQYSL